jgi:hypothetical protein
MRKSGALPIELDGFARLKVLSYRLPGGQDHEAVALERIG